MLIGWSFGGAPVFTVAGDDEQVVGCATVASQTAGTEGTERLAPRPVMLLHGKSDRTLGWWCSESLFRRYGDGGERELRLFEGECEGGGGDVVLVCDEVCRGGGAEGRWRGGRGRSGWGWGEDGVDGEGGGFGW